MEAFNASSFLFQPEVTIIKKVLGPLTTDVWHENLNSKVGNVAEVFLLMKKKQIVSQGGTLCMCSYYKEPGQLLDHCRSNPLRDTHCPRCWRTGKSMDICWSRPTTKDAIQPKP